MSQSCDVHSDIFRDKEWALSIIRYRSHTVKLCFFLVIDNTLKSVGLSKGFKTAEACINKPQVRYCDYFQISMQATF